MPDEMLIVVDGLDDVHTKADRDDDDCKRISKCRRDQDQYDLPDVLDEEKERVILGKGAKYLIFMWVFLGGGRGGRNIQFTHLHYMTIVAVTEKDLPEMSRISSETFLRVCLLKTSLDVKRKILKN